ncbi:MAG: hypothetical protein MI974_08790 [Chitinophagales bacterium]|nr:hypothetical protein [Chitinophagales bacterium]
MNIESYIVHLLNSPNGNSYVKAYEVLEISHSQITRLLNNLDYYRADFFDNVALQSVSTLSTGDSLIDKSFLDLKANDSVTYHWLDKHKTSV